MFGRFDSEPGNGKNQDPNFIHISKVQDLLNDLPLEVAFYDPLGRYRYLNDRYVSDPLIRKSLIGKKDRAYGEAMGFSEESLKKRNEVFARALKEKKVIHFTEKLYLPKEKKTLFYKRTIKPLFLSEKEGLLAGLFLFGSDISSTIRGQKEVRYMAYHDMLTGLKNRYSFNEYLDMFIRESDADHPEHPLYILYCDLDNFRIVNESLGHEIADQVLKEVSERIKLCINEGDYVFRLGGNEFAVVLRNYDDKVQVQKTTRKIIHYLSTTYHVNGHHLTYLTCSIGIVAYPEDGANKQVLMKNANIALYNAKRMGENSYQHFSQKMTNSAHKQMVIRRKLRSLVDEKDFDNQLEVHYQPIVKREEDNTYQVTGAEALIRWFEPELGAVDPGLFIPIAEEHNLITVLGEWVFRRVLKDYQSLKEIIETPPYLSVNFSARQFRANNLHNKIIKEVSKSGISPERIQIEITETSILDEHNNVQENIEALMRKGFRLAIDDFGVGYASLSYLHKIPADAVKIDQSFIKLLGSSEKHQKLVKSIIMLGENLGKDIIAEGVERTEELYLLDSYGCTKYQGYLFSQPLSLDDFKSYLQEKNLLTTLIYSV